MQQIIRLMIVDDEPDAIRALAGRLQGYGNICVCAKAFSSREAKLRLAAGRVDAVLLDVELGEEDGFELAAHIRAEYPHTAILFLTGHAELALRGYDFEPLDYLVKPLDRSRLDRAVQRLQKAFAASEEEEEGGDICLETAGGTFFIPAGDILYCELRNRRVHVGRRNGGEICCVSTIDRMEKLLEGEDFIKVYQSVLVRRSEIEAVEKDDHGQTYHVKLRTGGLSFPASRRFYYEAKQSVRGRSGPGGRNDEK